MYFFNNEVYLMMSVSGVANQSDDDGGDESVIGIAVGVIVALVIIIVIIIIILLFRYKKRFDECDFHIKLIHIYFYILSADFSVNLITTEAHFLFFFSDVGSPRISSSTTTQ